MNSIYDPNALRALYPDQQKQRLLRNAFFKKGESVEDCRAQFPNAESLKMQWLELEEQHDSKIDGASKLLFRCQSDQSAIEAVILRIATGRTSLCISSQVGCAVGCRFCATGALGLKRNLTTAEILDQVLIAQRLLKAEGRTLRNIVFMGMGEPLHNCDALFDALELLTHPKHFNLSAKNIMVSTVGIPDGIRALRAKHPDIRLALSLHSAIPETREQLIPIAAQIPLTEIMDALPASKTMIEYLLLGGVNDSPAHRVALIELLKNRPVHLNLIQLNPYPNCPYQPVTEEKRVEFGDALRACGITTTLRYSLGNDIAAACGQLANRAN